MTTGSNAAITELVKHLEKTKTVILANPASRKPFER
jgi:hypothetical protein